MVPSERIDLEPLAAIVTQNNDWVLRSQPHIALL
jgi:hypothetical protein